MITALVAVFIGFIILAWSADRLVTSASVLSHHLNVPPLIIGLVVIGFATSAPEMIVSAVAAWNSEIDMAIGNAIGSNIANIALVLGVTAIISPVLVSRGVIRREIPVLLGITAFFWLLMLDQHLSRLDGFILLSLLIVTLVLLVKLALRGECDVPEDPVDETNILPLQRAIMQLIFSLVLLMLSARLLVWGATEAARMFGISELVIGLTIVALGTSLPELAASISSALRRNHALALGNIIGSNLFNTLAVIGFPALIHPDYFSAMALHRDIPIMAAITVILGLLAMYPKGIRRPAGVFLLFIYVAYQLFVFQ